MSLSYFDDPNKKDAWDKELKAMQQEKARRMSGKTGRGGHAAVSGEAEALQQTAAGKSSRVQITYRQLLEREYGAPKPVQMSRSASRQMEKTKDMGGKNL